jgi:hypothetical protein
MADADRHNATERIKIPAPMFIKDVLPFTLNDHQRSFVVDEESRIQEVATQAQHLFRGWPAVWLRLIIEWW